MNTLHNKTAVITGAGSGIGQAISLALAKQHCNLAISDINAEQLQTTADLLSNHDINFSVHTVDIANRNAVKQFANEAHQYHGKINIIINNAGIALSANVEDIPYENFERLMAVNFWGVVYGCKEFLPYLKEAEEAHIINMSSMFGLVAMASQSAYNASKFAVRGFTEALQQELLIEQSSIKCSCIFPGFINTAIMKNASFIGMEKFGIEKNQAINDFSRQIKTSPEHVANVIIDAILKNRSRVVIGNDAKWLDFLQRLMPIKCLSIMANIRKKQYQK